MIECVPADKLEVLNVATPEAKVMVASVVAPSLKVTVPFGVPVPGATAVTVAVNATDWPAQAGLSDEVAATTVFALASALPAPPSMAASTTRQDSKWLFPSATVLSGDLLRFITSGCLV